MSELRCPGQDGRSLRAEDFAEVRCSGCGHTVEFWPDEFLRKCRQCGRPVTNPKLNIGCLAWCRYGAACAERMRAAQRGGAPPEDELPAIS